MRSKLFVALATAVLALGGIAGAPAAKALTSLPDGFEATDFVTLSQRLTAMAWAPDGRLFISQKDGNVRIVKNGVLLAQPFLTVATVTDSEKGLKGVEFDPNFASNGYVYVYYTDPATALNKVSRFTTSTANPDLADPTSEVVLIDGIGSGIYHSAGALHFGPDGKLYISTGDASYAPDSQNLHNLDGKILRINADGSIPSDNPFVGAADPLTRHEIWAYGLRNPFTFAFSPTGLMYINDVGNSTWEEIDRGVAGANYGWPTCEGICTTPGMTDPIYEYNHNDGAGKSITGAEFYRGTTFPAAYQGDYFFGDYTGNYIKRYDPQTGQVFDFDINAPNPVDLRTGPDGALYFLAVESHKVIRIQYTGATGPPPGQTEVSLLPSADDHVGSSTPDKNYGKSSLLYVQSSSDVDRTFIKWDLSSLYGKQVQAVAFKFHTSNAAGAGSTSSEQIHVVDDARWTELGLTYNNQPPSDTVLASIGPTAPDTDYVINLPANVIQDHLGSDFSIAIDSPGPRDNIYFYSRDAANHRPALIVDYTTPPPPVGQPPVPVINTPVAGTTYRAGDTISFSGSATDAEDGPLDPANLTWEVVFHHNTHTHPFVDPFSGVTSGSFVIPDTGEASDNTWYRVQLTATDSDGNSTLVYRDIFPLKSTVTLATVPAGLGLQLDGSPVTAPYSFVGVENFKRELTAPPTQTVDGHTYQFVSWSDGGAADHTIATPLSDATFTATYQDVTNPGTQAVADTFDRTVSSGWGSAPTGGTYVLAGGPANFNVSGGAATIALPATNANKSATLPGVYLQDADATVRVALDKAAVGGASYAYTELRVSGTNAYRPKLIFNPNGTLAVQAGVVVNGTESAVAPPVVVAGLTQTPGAFYWLRAQVSGINPTTIKVKAWADGQPEPTAWPFSATNSKPALQTAGGVALRAYTRSTNAPVVFTFDDFGVIGQAPAATPPAGPIVAQDTFGRTAANGWGSADTGGAYTFEGSAATFAVAGGTGTMRLPAAGAARVAYLPGVSATDVDARVRITADKSATGGSWYAYLVLRRQGTSAYQPKIIIAADGTVSVQAGVVVNGKETSLGAAVVVPGLTFTPGSFIWLRAQVSGTNPATIQVKAWADGQAEPPNWQFSATNSAAAVQTPGGAGLRAYVGGQVLNTPLVVTFDDFAVNATT